jgi:hypothetical protein
MIGMQELSGKEPRFQGLVKDVRGQSSHLHLPAPATRKRFLEVTVANMVIESRYRMSNRRITVAAATYSFVQVDVR